MKKKSLVALALAGVMSLSLVACGGSSSGDSGNSGGSNSGTTEKSTSGNSPASATSIGDVRILNGKPEIDNQLQELAAKYQEETGNKVNVETIGGDTNAADVLKGYYQADNMPDIFVIEANQASTWDGMLADLSGEEWTTKTDYALVDDKMGTIGFPYTVEATALGYNADILSKAGIDPSTLTSPDAYKKAFETLDAKKAELGLTAVVGYCAEPANLGWSSGTHVFGQYLDAGLAQNDTTYIDLLNDGGKYDETRLKDFANFVGMLNQYSDPELLVDGTYDKQVAGFAEGKYAFITQGSWIDLSKGDFEVGFAPYAFQDGIDTIIAGAPSYWTVYSEGRVDAAKAFLNWCYTDSAEKILVEDAGLISPDKDCKYQAANKYAASIKSYMDAGKTSGWHTMLKKDGLQNVTCQVFADFAKGSLDANSFAETLKQVTESYYAQ